MRYVLLVISLSTLGCSGQHQRGKQSAIDTGKLFNPTMHVNNGGASDLQIFERNIVLREAGYYTRLNGQEHEFKDLSLLKTFIKISKPEIRKGLIYLLVDSSTFFDKTYAVINALIENEITDYKVINVQQFFAPPEPVQLQMPTSVVAQVLDDSAYFTLRPLDNTIDVTLFGKRTSLKDTGALDVFLFTHKEKIKKVEIIQTKNLSVEKLNPILDLLKRHGYLKFYLVSEKPE
jgi:biopolymer transport protein ExbD